LSNGKLGVTVSEKKVEKLSSKRSLGFSEGMVPSG
jgi:hypothetical protein